MFREQDAVGMHGLIASLAQEDPSLCVVATAYDTGALVLWHIIEVESRWNRGGIMVQSIGLKTQEVAVVVAAVVAANYASYVAL